MNFDQTVTYLLGLGHETLAIKLGLRNIELLLQSLGNLERSFRSVQIAGTNGKGSTAIVLESICRAAGIRTGLYSSPHLVSITERIKIQGQDIDNSEFARYATIVREAAERLLAEGKIQALPTFFEQVTAIALLAFKTNGVEVAILETGLGGRLDATTAAGATWVGLTQIALDHQEHLGKDLASIAAEKAAIIRPGVKVVVVADGQSREALAIIEKRCEEFSLEPTIKKCVIELIDVSADGRFCVRFTTPKFDYEDVWLGLRGEHQIENVAVAIQLAENVCGFRSANEAVRAVVDGVATARHPGRLESIKTSREFLLDGAHNLAGASALRSYLERFAKVPLTIIFGCMRDKHLEGIAGEIFHLAEKLVLTPVDSPRTADVQQLRDIALRHLFPEQILVAKSAVEALRLALDQTPNGVVCVTGSLYLIGQLRPLILKSRDFEVAG